MSMLSDLQFLVTNRPPPPKPPDVEASPAAHALAATYGTSDAICVLVEHLDAKARAKLRHNLVNVGHRAKAKFGVSTATGKDRDDRAVLYAWAREPRTRQPRKGK